MAAEEGCLQRPVRMAARVVRVPYCTRLDFFSGRFRREEGQTCCANRQFSRLVMSRLIEERRLLLRMTRSYKYTQDGPARVGTPNVTPGTVFTVPQGVSRSVLRVVASVSGPYTTNGGSTLSPFGTPPSHIRVTAR